MMAMIYGVLISKDGIENLGSGDVNDVIVAFDKAADELEKKFGDMLRFKAVLEKQSAWLKTWQPPSCKEVAGGLYEKDSDA